MAATNHRDVNSVSRRVCIQREIAHRADWTHQKYSEDFVLDLERALKISALAGVVSARTLSDLPLDTERLRIELVRLGGDIQAWLEALDAHAAK